MRDLKGLVLSFVITVPVATGVSNCKNKKNGNPFLKFAT